MKPLSILVFALALIAFPFPALAEECVSPEAEAVMRRQDLSNRSFAACCSQTEATACVPALKERLNSALLVKDDARDLFDLKHILPALLRLGSEQDVQELERLYRENRANPLVTVFFADAFLDHRLVMAIKGMRLTADEIFPPAQLSEVKLPDSLSALPKDLAAGHKRHALIGAAEDSAKNCGQNRGKSSPRGAFWTVLSDYLLDETQVAPQKVLSFEGGCWCAKGSEAFASVYYGVRLSEFFAAGRVSEFVRAYALGWKKSDFSARRLCVYSGADLFNEGIDELFTQAGIDREAIYLGGLIAGDTGLPYEALLRNGSAATVSRLEAALVFVNDPSGQKIARRLADELRSRLKMH